MIPVDGPGGRDPEAAIDAYLLERLPADARAAVEDRVFADEDFAERMLARETDLLDALAAGTLPAEDARALAARLDATADGSRRLQFARTLRAWQATPASATTVPARVGPGPAVPPGRLPWISLAATVALAAGMAFLAVENARLRDAMRARDEPPPASTPAPASTPPSPAAPLRVVLDPSRTRGTEARRLVAVPQGAEAVHLVLPAIDGAGPFDARVETSPGAELVTHSAQLRPSSDRSLDVWIGTNLLRDGDYEIVVTMGRGPDAPLVGQYAFRVQLTRTSGPP